MKVRHVRLRVANVPWMEHYHGREAHLIGLTVDALEVTTSAAIAYVDDDDGEATELAEAVTSAMTTHAEHNTDATRRAVQRYQRAFEDHCSRRLLHGDVRGVRAAA